MTTGWLRGWKEIAAHVGVQDIRTVQGYERDWDMPVRRTPTGKVAALTHEIDLWLINFDNLQKKRKGKK